MCPDAFSASARIRPMTETDLPDVMRIERLSQPQPWPRLFFRRAMLDGVAVVSARNGTVLGYAVMQFRKRWAHIMNLCVDPAHRNHGLGRCMLTHLLQTAAAAGVPRAWLQVRPDNTGAIHLYRRQGFHPRRRHRGYYRAAHGRRQDALVMVHDHPQDAAMSATNWAEPNAPVARMQAARPESGDMPSPAPDSAARHPGYNAGEGA